MSNAYTEAQLVEQPAIELFAELGWATVSAAEEIFGAGGTLGRETPGEAVLVPRLRVALERLNPSLPPEAITAAVDELSRDRSAMSLAGANREVYAMLKDGVTVSVPDRENGGQKIERVRVIDWDTPAANDFLLASQMSITGLLYTRRPDLIGFVNGLPLVVIECKSPKEALRFAYDDNLTCYKTDIPQLFWTNAFLIVTNGTGSRIGTLTADWERFFEWKRIEREDEPRSVSLEVMIRGTCQPARCLDLVENFTLFSEHKEGLVKVLGQNHQFLGVNNAIAASMKAREEGHGRAGVFWQTQGSGKSFAMVFYAQKILRKIPGNWTFVVVTDRTDLDDQIAKTFKACGAVSEGEGDACHASSGAHLRSLLMGNHRYVFTLIQKFQSPEELCDRRDVVVLTDEAHRSQYDTLAVNMRAALPRALFLAFTGTPLIAGEERTREVFGDYVSIYDFQQSVEDGATVPLYYENRTPELRLENANLNEDLYDLIEAATLDEDQEARLERELGRQYHLITRDERLDTIAHDIVRHFLGRGFLGKAIVVSIDKATALRMYGKVRRFWQAEQERVEGEIKKLKGYKVKADPDQMRELERQLHVLTSTDMAVIVSPGQNEIEAMKKLGLDIEPHRKRINSEPLDEKFKDPEDPLRLVFVCAMWLTGFDAPSCSTVYLDKPMRNHTLMQTIARANRVFPGKHNGLIVDYANVFASLEKALAIYGQGRNGALPVREKAQLLADLKQAVSETTDFCLRHHVSVAEIESSATGSLERLKLLADSVNALISPDPVRKEFLASVRLVTTLYGAAKPDPAVLAFSGSVNCFVTLAGAIQTQLGVEPADISVVMSEINDLLDRSIAAEGFRIREAKPDEKGGKRTIDLSAIDFEALAKRFAQSQNKSVELERLKAAIRAQIDKLIRFNRTRADYLEKFEALIETYNSGSRNIEELFQELLNLSRSLNSEQERHVRENLREEELTVFDLLTRPGPELGPEERDEVKKVTRQLLERLRQLLVLDWRKRQSARAKVEGAIKDVLDQGLPRAYTPDLYQAKCNAVFEHVYESYQGEGKSVFTEAA